jgi:hypothetical protein
LGIGGWLGAIELGHRDPPISSMMRIAHGLGVKGAILTRIMRMRRSLLMLVVLVGASCGGTTLVPDCSEEHCDLQVKLCENSCEHPQALSNCYKCCMQTYKDCKDCRAYNFKKCW